MREIILKQKRMETKKKKKSKNLSVMCECGVMSENAKITKVWGMNAFAG